MTRILYDRLLTESGFALLTESGDPLALREIGMAGDATVDGANGSAAGTGSLILRGSAVADGQPGSVAGTGRLIAVAPPDVVPGASGLRPAKRPTIRPVLRGQCAATGYPGGAAGRGRLTLIASATATGGRGTAAITGRHTLVGDGAATGGRGNCRANGDVFDEMALILAMAA